MNTTYTLKRLFAVARLWKLWTGLLALGVLILWTGGACQEKVAPGKVAYHPGTALPPGAERLTVTNRMVAARVDLAGTVASQEKIHLSSRIQAFVKDVLASAGDRVKKGQLLIQLDDREIREQLAAAEAQLKQAQTEFSRVGQLLETKAATQQAYEAAESAHRSAQANVDRVKVMVSYALIASPIDGILTDRRIEVGDLANPGQVLLTVYDSVNMRLEAAVPVRLVERLAMGQQVDIVLDRPARHVRGTIVEFVSEIEPSSRTQTVKIRLDDAPDGVLPGTFGRVWIEEHEHPAILIPPAAVYRLGQLEYVQVAQNERAVRRLVRTAPRTNEQVEILSGLSEGDTILLNPVKED